MNITPEINEKLAETFAVEEPKRVKPSDERLVIRFDPSTCEIWPEAAKHLRSSNRLTGAVVLSMTVNEGARTPTGGRFVSTRMTVSYKGRKWVGQTKNGTDVVKLRPMPKPKDVK